DEKITQLIDGNNKTNTFALLFIDIDNFKEINDTYGHKYGDIALKLIASRIKRSIRENDFLCRFGGDEFILLVEGIQELNDLKGYANRLMKIFKHPFCMDTYSLSITCSMGISVYPDHGKDEDILLQKADKIMYQTKQQGKNGFLITNDDK
ncbi:MAG TPA: GGDEF domain-containing protein, partial [Niallia sp.]|nr:GGDEF domain-containing protein [Niallia sp.]